MNMAKRHRADARLKRVTRIVGNQTERMAPYLRSRPPSPGEDAFRTLWAQVASCPWEQCIELGYWAGSALDSSFLLPQEDLRRKKALECMKMPMRYSADARLRRVARIVGNQMGRMASYLRSRPSSQGGHAFRTLWALMPPYDKSRERASAGY